MSGTSDGTGTANQIVERDDLGDGDAGVWRYWDAQERIVEKDERTWVRRGRRIIRRYRDERDEANRAASRFNILWSNVQTLKPTLYARTPKADVQRRWLDPDDTGRLASLLLERCIEYSLEQHGFDAVMEAVVEDRLLPGRGVARVVYVPHFGDEIEDEAEGDQTVADAGDEAGAGPQDNEQAPEEQPLRAVVYEEVKASYVFWEDYREGAARTWA